MLFDRLLWRAFMEGNFGSHTKAGAAWLDFDNKGCLNAY